MADRCRNGHLRTGRCQPCRRASDLRYRATEKGKAEHRRSQARYIDTTNGQLNRLEADVRRLASAHKAKEVTLVAQ